MSEEVECIFFCGLHEAVIGIANVWDSTGMKIDRVVYSGEKIVEILMRGGIETEEEAVEFIDFNIEGAYVGPNTPIVVWEMGE